MNFIKPLISAVVLLLSLQTIAQEKVKRLYVGDKVPDLQFNGMHNYPSTTAKLSDFKGKTVILDFWNKGCTSCIAAFPKMQQIQEEFKDDLVILLINDQADQTLETLDPLFKRSAILKETKLPMVFGNEIFGSNSELFPHYSVPYHVWIDKNGIIQATTHGYDATRENIKKLIEGVQLDVVKRVDILEKRDDTTSWLTYGDGLFINNLVYYSSDNFMYKNTSGNTDLSPLKHLKLGEQYHTMFLKRVAAGNLAGGSVGSLKDSNGKAIGGYVKNPLSFHYRMAYDFNKYPIVIEDDGTLGLEDEYIYEFIHPNYNYTYTSWQEPYKKDLENYFGYRGSLEMRYIDCYILYRTHKDLRLPKSKGGEGIMENTLSARGYVIKNNGLSALLSLLADSHKDKFSNPALIFDETGFSDQGIATDLNVRGDLENISSLNTEFSKYGLGIKKEQRMSPVLLLKKVK